jgi:hypothetical protein
VDINECKDGNPCGRGNCVNVDGAYDCQCHAGFQVQISAFLLLKYEVPYPGSGTSLKK